MKTFNGLPLFTIELGDGGVHTISLVDKPATEIEMITLAKETMYFSSKDKQIIVAPVITANKPILRNTNQYGYAYIMYTPDVIEQMQMKYFAQNRQHSWTENHDGTPVPNATMFESWIIENDNDKAYTKYNFNKDELPIGSWMSKVHIANKEYWDKMKDKNFTGISLEGDFYLKESIEHSETILLSMLYDAFNNGKSLENIE